MARLFLALPVAPKTARRLAEEAERLALSGARVSWVPAENLHLTVRFLGEADDGATLDLIRALEGGWESRGPLELVAVGLGAFPDLQRPRIVWCGVRGKTPEDTDRLQELRRNLDGLTRELGWHREKGVFQPHITLGRVRGEAQLETLVSRIGPGVRREFGHYEAPELHLFESRQGPEGSEYTPLTSFPL